MDFLPCGIFKIDKDRKVLRCNQYALDLLSDGADDVIVGLPIEQLISAATRIFIDSYVYPMLLNEGRVEEIQLSLKSVAGKTAPIVANIHITPNKTTYWTFMSCINRDQLYSELLSARDTLQSQALHLTQLNAQIHERESDLQAFCHSLSHDFTGPLRRIRQLIEFAMEDMQEAGIEAPEEFKLLDNARENSVTLIDMTKGLVDYLVADVAVLHNEVVDLEEVVLAVLAMREAQDSTMPKVRWTSFPTLFGSKAQIQVLFKNLIENAIKYNNNDPEITISHAVDVATGRCIIAIKDNGIGMSDAYVDTIFKPFTRLHTSSEYKGSGLGLSIVRKMVLNHQGDIRVESIPGSGSTFYVSLPLNTSQTDDP